MFKKALVVIVVTATVVLLVANSNFFKKKEIEKPASSVTSTEKLIYTENDYVQVISEKIADKIYKDITSDPELAGEIMKINTLPKSGRDFVINQTSSQYVQLVLSDYDKIVTELLKKLPEGSITGISKEEFAKRTKPRVIETTSLILSKKLESFIESF